jgi:coenzyme F420-reducing hydrogenase delta subunit/ferredoxin
MVQLAQPVDAPTAPAAAAAAETWQPRIVALICNWCTYAGADMAGTTRRAYAAAVRPVRVPCTGRLDPLLILKAFEQGADGVLISGCHPGDCHYVQGNLVARRRFTAVRTLMEFLGLDPRRLQFAWVSASEGVKWSHLVDQVTAAVREAGPLREWGRLADGRRSPVRLPAVPPAPRPAPPASAQAAVAEHLQRLAATLLAEGQAGVVIGYAAGSLPGQMVPAFVTRPEDTAALAWGDACLNNLAVYLPGAQRESGKVAIVVKRCDARAVVGLLQESQVKRDDLVLIGVSCPGVREEGELALKCYACDGEVAAVCDWTVSPEGARKGAVPSGAQREVAADPRDALVAHLESLPAADRWAYWQEQFARCLRCYGCRAVCPLCYCTVCVAEKNRPQWVPASIDGKGNLVWNVTRALHLVGRCGGCDECARVCPADVRLDLLNHRLGREVEQRFGYRSGEDAGATPPLDTFRPDDAQEFIR